MGSVGEIVRIIQFSDSTFPVGSFSFSNGLETAAHIGAVHDAKTLEEFVRAAAVQAAFTDGVAALSAFRAFQRRDYAALFQADAALIRTKMNSEARMMLTRMGTKMAELLQQLYEDGMLALWHADIKAGKAAGTYPVAQAFGFGLAGLTEEALFASHQYGVINMILSAALRCVRVSHIDTQKILFALTGETDGLYRKVRLMRTEDMNAFVPMLDIFASMHEKGSMRMFMN
jgi:urease accessory protein